MNTRLRFGNYKNELTTMVEGIIRQFLGNKIYNRRDAQLWCNRITNEVKIALHQQQREFKYIIQTNIFRKGDITPSFGHNSLWNRSSDGSIVVKYENATLKCFVTLFAMAPEQNKNTRFQIGSRYFK